MQLERETKDDIKKIQSDFDRNKDKVIEMLVEKVLHVDLSIPNSVKEKFARKWLFVRFIILQKYE